MSPTLQTEIALGNLIHENPERAFSGFRILVDKVWYRVDIRLVEGRS